MSALTEAWCLVDGHADSVDIDPTGGDPWMGGPVMITVCVRCKAQVETSVDAQVFNERVRIEWETENAKQQDAWPPKRHRNWLKFWRKED